MPDGQYTQFPIDYENISAAKVPYSNSTSGLTATNVQSAIDEVAQGGGGGGAVDSVNGKTGIVTLTASDVSTVPTTRTVNNKSLSSNITLTASDVSAVPTTRTVNSKTLSSDITLSASDVGAIAQPSILAAGKYLKFDGSAWIADDAPVTSVNGRAGAVTLSIPSTAADVGAIAAPSSPSSGQFLSWNGSAWVAADLPVYTGGVS